MCPQLSAIDVTTKTFFKRLYLVLRLRKIAPWVNCPYAPSENLETLQYSCVTPNHKSPTNSSNLEYSKRRTTRRRRMSGELISIYNFIYLHRDLPVTPPRTHHIHHTIHDTCTFQVVEYFTPRTWICQIFKGCPSEITFYQTMRPNKIWSKITGNKLSDALERSCCLLERTNWKLNHDLLCSWIHWSKDSQRESLWRCAGLFIHLYVCCDLVVMYATVASCWVIVPLMTFACVFGAGFVKNQCV